MIFQKCRTEGRLAKRDLVTKVKTRSLRVTAEEAELFPFDHKDILIAQAMITGARTPLAIAEETELKPDAVRHRLLDPVRCAWISREISKAVESRLGNVLGAVYARVMRSGDPQAAKLLLAQYGKLLSPVDKSVHEHRHLHMDFKGYSQEQLETYVTEQQRKHGLATEGEGEPDPIDVEHTTGDDRVPEENGGD